MKKNFKKIVSAFLSLALITSIFSANSIMTYNAVTTEEVELQWATVWNGSADTTWFNKNVYEFEIDSAEKLAGLAKLVNDGEDFDNRKVSLTKSIILNEVEAEQVESWYDESVIPQKVWSPIGISSSDQFEGIFDAGIYNEKGELIGCNVVKGMYINSPDSKNVGFFGFAEDSQIKNLVVDCSFVAGKENVGILAGTAYGLAEVENCKTSNSYVKGTDYVGGLIGFLDRSDFLLDAGKVTNCESDTNVYAYGTYVGGITGCQQIDWVIRNAVNNGYVFSDVNDNNDCYVGGIVGYNEGAIYSSKNNGDISASDREVGGIAGRNESYSTDEDDDDGIVERGIVSKCENNGSIIIVATDGSEDIGGIVGENNGVVSNSVNIGEIISDSVINNIGGIVGYNYGADIKYCYNIGLVDAANSQNVGGIVGLNYKLDMGTTSMVIACYNASNVFGLVNAGAVAGFNDVAEVRQSYYDMQLCSLNGIGKSEDSFINKSVNEAEALLTDKMKETLPDSQNYRLNGSEKYHNGYPLLKTECQLYVVKFNFEDGSNVEVLSNEDGTVSYDEIPTNGDKVFVGWYSGVQRIVVTSDNNEASKVYHDAVISPLWLDNSNELKTEIVNGVIYYLISSYSDLCWYRDFINSGNKANAKLTNDVYINNKAGYEDWDDNAPGCTWLSIGALDASFSSIFDGCGHTIYGLYQDSEFADNLGLFGYVSGAVIKNLNLEAAYVRGNDKVAALAGEIRGEDNQSLIYNCNVNSSIINGNNNVGSVAGYATNSAVQLCKNTADVTVVNDKLNQTADNTYTVGGILGFATGMIVNSCENSGTVINNANGKRVSGGIVGQMILTESTRNNSIVKNSINLGTLDQSENEFDFAQTIGGIVGINGNTLDESSLYSFVVENTLSLGKINVKEVSSENAVQPVIGEIVGLNTVKGTATTKASVKNSYFSNTVNSLKYYAIGDNLKGTVDEKTTYADDEALLLGETTVKLGEAFGQALKSSTEDYDKYPRLLDSTNKVYTIKLHTSTVDTNPVVMYVNDYITADELYDGNYLSSSNSRVFLGWSTSAKSDSYISNSNFVTGDMSLYAQYYTIPAVAVDSKDKTVTSGSKPGFETVGVQINVKEGKEALRFCARVSDSLIEKLGGTINKINKQISGVEIGYLTCNAKKLSNSAITSLELDSKIYENRVNIIENIELNSALKTFDKYNLFAAETGKISLMNYDSDIAARLYIKYIDKNGAERTFYYTDSDSDSVAGAYVTSLYKAAKMYKVPETNRIVNAYDAYNK